MLNHYTTPPNEKEFIIGDMLSQVKFIDRGRDADYQIFFTLKGWIKMKILSTQELKAIEKAAIDSGISSERMMVTAGTNLAKWVIESFEMTSNHIAVGLIGSGNNGSDTLIALIYLLKHGWQCMAFLAKERSAEDRLLSEYRFLGGALVMDMKLLSGILHYQPLLLDGILGTGFHSPMEGRLTTQIDLINLILKSLPNKPLIIAVDCPSGVDCDNGAVGNPVIAADFTACMGAVKQGLLDFPAFEYCGKLKLIQIGLPEEIAKINCDSLCIDDDFLRANLPIRGINFHKGTFGRCAIVAGSSRYPGAALLASKAAYLSGAGLVSILSTSEVQNQIAGSLPEATWLHIDDDLNLKEELSSYTSMLIGPGLGTDPTARNQFEKLWQFIKQGVEGYPGQLIFDADGLRILSTYTDWSDKLPGNTILTPHPGEMACLTGLSIEDVQSNRWDCAKEFAKKWQKIVVLKGALSVVADPSGHIGVIPIATSGLATAGTGDILSGMIAGMCAQGVEAFNACLLCSFLHAKTGLKAETKLKQTFTITASDIFKFLPEAFID